MGSPAAARPAAGGSVALGLEAMLADLGQLPEPAQREIAQLVGAQTAHIAWVPNSSFPEEGPQRRAYVCEADETLYGGQAGGGKSDLLLGLAVNEHERGLILRRYNKDVEELGERLLAIAGNPTKGYNSQKHILKRGAGQVIQLAGCERERDKQRFKGRARDFIGYDELADFTESQYVFINTWNRSTKEGQRCRVVGATNGPTTAEGQWILRRWAAWLDPKHPNPAKDGELRWYTQVDGQEVEVDGPGPHVLEGSAKPLMARSRTFIRSKLDDNPDLARSDYAAGLDSLPEELRRVYRDGDFTVGLSDDAFQAIPTAWIDAAQQRWTAGTPTRVAMTAVAVDIAKGGKDKTVLSARYGGWFAPLIAVPGTETREGPAVAGLVVKHRKSSCPVIVDVGGGWGAEAVIALKDNAINVVAYNGVEAVTTKPIGPVKLKFRNKRAESYWRFREALDPEQEGGSSIALPPDPELKADLAAVHWFNTTQGIQMQDKDEIKKVIGRSPDRGDAVVMCLSEGDIAAERAFRRRKNGGGGIKVNLGHSNLKGRR